MKEGVISRILTSIAGVFYYWKVMLGDIFTMIMVAIIFIHLVIFLIYNKGNIKNNIPFKELNHQQKVIVVNQSAIFIIFFSYLIFSMINNLKVNIFILSALCILAMFIILMVVSLILRKKWKNLLMVGAGKF
jgi:hypothetical protein